MGVNSLKAVTSHFPQTEGNRVTEAPKVVSNLTQRDEGAKAPLPNDSLASISPQVGVCLHSSEETGKKKNVQMC